MSQKVRFVDNPTAESWNQCSEKYQKQLVKWAKNEHKIPRHVQLAERIKLFNQTSKMDDAQLYGLEALVKVTSLLKQQPDITAIIRYEQKTVVHNLTINYKRGNFEVVFRDNNEHRQMNKPQLYHFFAKIPPIEQITIKIPDDLAMPRLFYSRDLGIVFTSPVAKTGVFAKLK